MTAPSSGSVVCWTNISDMNSTGRLAIIIPAYKGNFLQEAIESVLGQQDNNYLLYIFNDDSPDERVKPPYVVRWPGIRK